MKKTGSMLACLLAGASLFAADPRLPGADAGRRTSSKPSFESDRNGDGTVDYRSFNDSKGRREYEELDYNYDGKMDDFYFFKDGTLEREEIDSDFNGRVDVWIWLYQGEYIRRIEQDKDGDGKPDYVKDYDKAK